MNATPEGNSSCSEGRNAGPFRLRELLAGVVVVGGSALVPAADVTLGDAIISCTPSSSSSSSRLSSCSLSRLFSRRRRISSSVPILAVTSAISALTRDWC